MNSPGNAILGLGLLAAFGGQMGGGASWASPVNPGKYLTWHEGPNGATKRQGVPRSPQKPKRLQKQRSRKQ